MSLLKNLFYKENKTTTPINDKEIWIRDTYAIWMQANFQNFDYFCEGPFDQAIASRQRFLLSRDWGVKSANDCFKLVEDLKTRQGDKGDLSWNLCRIMQLYAMSYCAGYFTREEMIDYSSKIAVLMQSKFTSWDDLAKSYLIGHENWARYIYKDAADEQIKIRHQSYNEVKFAKNPAFTINWNYNFYN